MARGFIATGGKAEGKQSMGPRDPGVDKRGLILWQVSTLGRGLPGDEAIGVPISDEDKSAL
jgi:hypothetical protein